MWDLWTPIVRGFWCMVVLAILLGVLGYVIGANCGCAAIGASRALYGGGPPFHVYHPDANDDLICDRYGDLLPGVTIDEALDRAREIDDHQRAHGGMP